MAVVNNDLFSQASSQLNFLLLSHRTMILVAAFTIAFATFVTTESFKLMKYIVVALFAFSIAYGFKAAEDFNKYISDAKKDGDTSKEEKELLDIWENMGLFFLCFNCNNYNYYVNLL